MRKNILKYSILIIFLIFISLGFTSIKEIEINENFKVTGSLLNTVSMEEEPLVEVTPPFLGKSFVGFKEALGFKESRGDYFVTNHLGYIGKYQFGASTLRLIGIHDSSDFLNDPELQERAFIANTARNKWVLRRDIKRSVGKRIGGVYVTESGILAAAHLAGPGNVKTYLRSGGVTGFKDANGTSIRYYMRKFSGYDTSYIQPDKKAKI
ncbi:peptidoglycan-binding protein LysM [Sinomicrobium weinanense]|uniref:Peptidoglycan-binding protein LysM n=1 Tax=Sinomicrobium weinanense TaxID=2842200 RepID=A0A926Q4M8_9FLAO|nr:peptidoglycan-binding protein LysM [Sinomicrobium weinanense]MBC9797065.1 peptidoglycan-binding protein LysM [Sinomicrobium weinanense]MBU3122706.1 peptidoglycan-binding protein LysM [Sinomicrobium weinanense]